MGIGNHSSAGVYPNEIDVSGVVRGASTSIGAILGWSRRGPVGVRTLITDTKKFLAKFGEPRAADTFMHYCALAFLEHSSRLYVTRVAPGSKYGGMVVKTVTNLSVAAPWAAGTEYPTEYNFAANDLFVIYGADPGVWNKDVTVQVYPNTKINDGTFYLDVYVRGANQPMERHLVHLDYIVDGFGVQLNVEARINKKSEYIRVKQNEANTVFLANRAAAQVNALCNAQLIGGHDGTAPTTSDIINAWDLYRDPEKVSVNILINGGYSIPAVQHAMEAVCRSRGDCIAVLDTPPMEQRVSDAVEYRRNTLNADTNYAALYTPDYLILDQYSDIRLYVPPSGHVAGAYARTDTEAATWFAPAGMSRGRLNILGVRHVYNQGDRDTLADSQINATRVIPGEGIKIWGADTLQARATALSNVSVRRLMMFLETSLSRAVLHSVFDPNDYILRAELVDEAERFLKPIRQARGLYDFSVICDETNNGVELISSGDLVMDVYVDPVLPAKRIHLKAIITKTGARFVQ